MLKGNNTPVPAFKDTHSHSYLKSAVGILLSYDGSIPFHNYLRKYFSQNKKHGSKDRKSIAALCYSYFRLGHAVMELPVEERILIGVFLCNHENNEILKAFRPAWNEKITSALQEKYSLLNNNLLHVPGHSSFAHGNIELRHQFSIQDVFPFKNELSKGADHMKFCESFLAQPDLFLRLRPGKEQIVKQKLKSAGIGYQLISASCISLPNALQVGAWIKPDKEAVVQDYNSQMVGKMLQPVLAVTTGKNKIDRVQLSVWDCCAASGGKSILAYDINPSIQLTVSDKRSDIIQTLKQRFERASIRGYHAFVADLSKKDFLITGHKDSPGVGQHALPLYDLIIADVPCTGSGTWSRTPEQLYYFNKKDIERYSSLQKQIVTNIIPHLKPGGHLLYVTCSVFKNENEQVVDYVEQNFSLSLKHMELLKGYSRRADTMFAALFKNL
jgi:16S rRNA (cytosine967-C5)-methyltransferase